MFFVSFRKAARLSIGMWEIFARSKKKLTSRGKSCEWKNQPAIVARRRDVREKIRYFRVVMNLLRAPSATNYIHHSLMMKNHWAANRRCTCDDDDPSRRTAVIGFNFCSVVFLKLLFLYRPSRLLLSLSLSLARGCEVSFFRDNAFVEWSQSHKPESNDFACTHRNLPSVIFLRL